MGTKGRVFAFILLFAVVACGFLSLPERASALTVEELEQKIEETRREKARLEEENRKLKAQIEVTNKEANTLQGAVQSLDAAQRKIQGDINVTQKKINAAQLTIEKLQLEIGTTENNISTNKEAIAETLRSLDQTEGVGLLEAMLSYKNINDLWDSIEKIKRFQASIKSSIDALRNLKNTLEVKKAENEGQKVELAEYKTELSDQETVVAQNKKAKNALLVETRNKEAEYQAMLQRNIELGKKFEQELFQYESELQIIIDKSKLPTLRKGVLAWPLDSIFITQQFGHTSDSKRLYVSGTHNGVDFRAGMGTPVKSVADGIVAAVGNTDAQKGCYSYGRWALIKHNNGLTSMYAHLSGLKVAQGDSVSMGQVIGWSGGQPGTSGAGYSTGPHLHLTLFASDGVRVQKYVQSNFCKEVSIPIAPPDAYLDPIPYLPAI